MLGLLLVDHGSRRPEANAQLDDMAARIRRLMPGIPLAAVHLEVCPPTIAEGVAALLAQGCSDLRVLPYFLSAGRHLSQDIPTQLQAALATHPQVRWTVGGALGPDDALAALMLTRGGLSPGAPPASR